MSRHARPFVKSRRLCACAYDFPRLPPCTLLLHALLAGRLTAFVGVSCWSKTKADFRTVCDSFFIRRLDQAAWAPTSLSQAPFLCVWAAGLSPNLSRRTREACCEVTTWRGVRACNNIPLCLGNSGFLLLWRTLLTLLSGERDRIEPFGRS